MHGLGGEGGGGIALHCCHIIGWNVHRIAIALRIRCNTGNFSTLQTLTSAKINTSLITGQAYVYCIQQQQQLFQKHEFYCTPKIDLHTAYCFKNSFRSLFHYRGAGMIREQIEDREQQRLLETEKKDQETQSMLRYLERLQQEDMDNLVKKRNTQTKLMEEVALCNDVRA